MKDPESQVEELILVLAEMHSKEMSPAFIVIYKRALLSALSPDEAIMALNLAFTSKTYGFPKPYDLIEMLRGSGEDQGFHAWEQLNTAIQQVGPYRSVLFSDVRITRVIEAMGGWIEVNSWMVEDLKFRRQEFMKLYRSASGSGSPRHLPGLTEARNTAMGYLGNIPDPVRIGGPGPDEKPGPVLFGDPRLTGALQELVENIDPEHRPDDLN